MPKMPNYNKAVIYKIQHQEKPELIYVGSTTDFTNRKSLHKSACNNSNYKNHNSKVYKMIRDNEGWDAFKVIIIKEFPCVSKIELLLEEDKMMIELKSSLNCIKAHNTDEEKKQQQNKSQKQYDDGNKDKKKQYQEVNKDKIKERMKKYYDTNKDKFKEDMKRYNETNKDKIKEYIQANKDKINARRRARRQELKQTKDELIV